jgi:hypothetical protein
MNRRYVRVDHFRHPLARARRAARHMFRAMGYASPRGAICKAFPDTDLGITTFLNGTLVSNIVVDTSQVATDTIDYVATDNNGLTASSTRTVIIKGEVNTVTASSTAN